MIRRILKAALPRPLVQLLRDLARLESGARLTYLRLALGRRRHGALPPLTRSLKIITICHGNILRSAYAELLLRQRPVAEQLPGLEVSSAGLHAIPGRSADPRGVAVASENSLDLSSHRATLLSAQLVASADLLLVMDRLNEAELISRHPEAAHKVVLLGEFDSASSRDPVIPDPYTGDLDAVRASYSRVASAVAGLVTKLGKA